MRALLHQVTGYLAGRLGSDPRRRMRNGMAVSVIIHITLLATLLTVMRQAEGEGGELIEISFASLAQSGLQGDSDQPEDEDQAASQAMEPEIAQRTEQQELAGQALDRLVEESLEHQRQQASEKREQRQSESLDALAQRIKDRAARDRLRGERLADLESELANVRVGFQGRLFGKVVARNVIFCIDESASMFGDKLALTKRELIHVIEQVLPEGSAFEIIAFSSECSAWRGELTTLDDQSRADARAWVRERAAEGATSTFEALRRAFAKQDVEAVYLLTDGEPTDGTGDSIRAWVRQANGSRHVVVNTVGFLVGYPAGAALTPQRFLEGLAEENHGTCRIVR